MLHGANLYAEVSQLQSSVLSQSGHQGAVNACIVLFVWQVRLLSDGDFEAAGVAVYSPSSTVCCVKKKKKSLDE